MEVSMSSRGRRYAGGVALALCWTWTAVTYGQPPAASVSPVSSTKAAGDYRIGPEDLLDISVWKNADLTQTVQVRPDGRISLPLLNDIQAADLTPMQLREVLVARYAAYLTQPEISVAVREVRSFKVSVLGMVRTPGRYDIRSAITVLEALALAGGFTEFAKRDRVFVSRRILGGFRRMPFDYLKVLDGIDSENFALAPGDIIVVP
jgi:polysaccharide biosynthesis/export protein